MKTVFLLAALIASLLAPVAIQARGVSHPVVCGYRSFGSDPRGAPTVVYICKRY